MAKVHHPTKPQLQWTEEQMRQRGVRAVVAAMRLGKERQHLAHLNAFHLHEAKTLRDYLMWLKTRNIPRVKVEISQKFSKKRNSNSWMIGSGSHSQYGGRHT